MVRIYGLNKTTLLDYPGHVAATVFLGGCNFRCPFCHNGDLALCPEGQPVLAQGEVLEFLKKRKQVLSGVCITGGEPTLSDGLEDLIKRIKDMGYMVKLDTNGYEPGIVRRLVTEGILDYIAMDIKNCMERYGETAGLSYVDVERVRESIKVIKESAIEYEFRTTIVRELHGKAELEAVGREIEGAKAYFLQSYRESAGVITPGFHGYDRRGMERLAGYVRPYVERVELRGVE